MKKLTLIAAIIISAANLIGQSFQIDIPGKEINLETYNLNSKSDFLKQPYLIFEGINTQMRVIWQLSETATCTISWGTDSTYSLGNATTTEYGNDHQHSYTITELTPGTKFHYKVEYDDAIVEASFKTAPPDDAANLKFFVYGDTRSDFENHNLNSQAMVNDYTANPDFQSLTLFTGDHVFYGADESSWSETFFTTNAPYVRKRMAEVPFVSCLGNHELYGSDYSLHHDTELFGKYFPFPFVERRYWSFDYGPMHVAVLDQYPDYYQLLPLEGFLDSLQLVWLEQDLSSTDKPWKVIILHEPGWSCEGSSSGYNHPNNPDVQNKLQPMMEDYGVQILFSAHNHYYARTCKNGIYHITTAGGGAPLYEIEEEFPNVLNTYKVHHYCKVAIEGDTMTVTAVKPDGEVIDEFQLDENNRPDHLLGFLDKEDGPGDISDVNITADGLFASPDSVGYYGLELAPGYHEASFLLSGYVPLTETVEITEGTETQLDTILMLGQGCLPEGITFSTQEEIDNFQLNYPNCDEIQGDVEIIGNGITNLDGLNILTSIGGSFLITADFLVNLTGLDNVNSIGGNFYIHGNDALTSLSGMENLTTVSSHLAIYNNLVLTNISGLGNLSSIGFKVSIYDNASLSSLSGLENINTIGSDLTIYGNTVLANLTGLEGLVSINGSLNVGAEAYYGNPALTNLSGLQNLTSIGEDLRIFDNNNLISLTDLTNLTSLAGSLYIEDNPALTSLAGLGNLTSVAGFFINNNDALTDLLGLEGLTSVGWWISIQQNNALTSLSGLEGLTIHPYNISIRYNDALASLSGLNNLTTINGYLTISGNDALTSLSGLESITHIKEGLTINHNDALTSLTGLENLTSFGSNVAASLNIKNNYALTSLTGLQGLTSITGSLYIEANHALTSLTGLDNLNLLGGGLSLKNNSGLNSLAGLENLTTIGGGLAIGGNDALINLTGLEGLNSISGDVFIGTFGYGGNYALTSLSGLHNVISIGGNLVIAANDALTSLTGLENLTTLGEGLAISGNDALINLSGLEGLNSINGELNIGGIWWGGGNDALTSLSGLQNVISIGGNFTIASNNALGSLTGLDNLGSISGDLTIGGDSLYSGNIALTDIHALGVLAGESINNLKIGNNSSLSSCAVQSICDYLTAPGGFIEIHDNAEGCNTTGEVEEACLEISVNEFVGNSEISISPNPVNDQAVLSMNLQSKSSIEIYIYNTTGICLKSWQFQNQQPGEREFKLDLKDIPAGVYFCRVKLGNEMVTKKIIKL